MNHKKNLLTVLPPLLLIPLAFSSSYANGFVQTKLVAFRLIILLLCLVIFIYIWRRNNKSYKFPQLTSSPIAICIGALGLLMLFTSLISDHFIHSLYGSFTRGGGLITLGFVVIWILLLFIANIKKAAFSIGYTLSYISGVIIAAAAVLQKVGFDPLFAAFDVDIFVGRSFAFLGNPGYLGQFLALMFIIGCYLAYKHQTKLVRGSLVIGQVLILLGIISSESRSAILALFVACGLIVLKLALSHRNLIRKHLSTSLLILVITSILLMGSSVILSSSGRLSLTQKAWRSMESRFVIWETATTMISDAPLLGYGLSALELEFPNYVNKEFFTLEENLHLNVDRTHNEFLEILLAGGVPAGLLYLWLIVLLGITFFRNKDPLVVASSLVVLTNTIQNQLSFSDLSIKLVIAYALFILIRFEVKKNWEIDIPKEKYIKISAYFVMFILLGIASFNFVYKPIQAARIYTVSQILSPISYEASVLALKDSIFYTPQYRYLWYQLMLTDSSSIPRSVHYLTQIEGETSELLGWQANYFRESDYPLSEEFFLSLIERNPNNPHWLRAYADAAYVNKEYETALEYYRAYLNSLPDYWDYEQTDPSLTTEQKRQARIFNKNVPDLIKTTERIVELEGLDL